VETDVRRAAVLLALALLAGCDGARIVQGQVLDGTGKPVAGASVQLFGDSERPPPAYAVRTDSDGQYRLAKISNALGKKRLRLIVSKNGYKTYDQAFDSSFNQPHTADITLERDDGK
jgi:Carboxypeptidase regulatory-like domain